MSINIIHITLIAMFTVLPCSVLAQTPSQNYVRTVTMLEVGRELLRAEFITLLK